MLPNPASLSASLIILCLLCWFAVLFPPSECVSFKVLHSGCFLPAPGPSVHLGPSHFRALFSGPSPAMNVGQAIPRHVSSCWFVLRSPPAHSWAIYNHINVLEDRTLH